MLIGGFTAFGVLIAMLVGGVLNDTDLEPLNDEDKTLSGWVGQDAPDFELVSLNSDGVRLSDLQGQVVFLNFWATWCVPCRAEMPAFDAFSETHDSDEFIVLAVNIEEHERDITAFLDEVGVDDITVLLDRKGDVQVLYGVFQLPTTFIIDANGVIRSIRLGEMRADDLDEFVGYFERNPG